MAKIATPFADIFNEIQENYPKLEERRQRTKRLEENFKESLYNKYMGDWNLPEEQASSLQDSLYRQAERHADSGSYYDIEDAYETLASLTGSLILAFRH